MYLKLEDRKVKSTSCWQYIICRWGSISFIDKILTSRRGDFPNIAEKSRKIANATLTVQKNIYCLYIVSCNLDYTSVRPSEPYLSENRAKLFLPFLIIAHIMEQIIQFELHLFISFKKRRIWNKIWKKTLRWKKGNVYWNKVLNDQLDAPNQRY